MELLSQAEAEASLAWFDGGPGDGWAGYAPEGWETNAWIVHAMYETAELPEGLSYDEARRIEEAAGVREPLSVGDVNIDAVLNEMMADSTVIGGTLGRSGWPGPGWNRLLWSELATRLDVDPYAIPQAPCFLSFPYSSWPVSIAPPGEGSLDREQFVRLVDRLAEESGDGYATRCFSYYGPLATGDFDVRTVYSCGLGELTTLYDNDELAGSPSNIWPHDKSWFVYTDWDLWGTRVSGSKSLIARLVDDDELEAVMLDR